jgi:hypothetical protein
MNEANPLNQYVGMTGINAINRGLGLQSANVHPMNQANPMYPVAMGVFTAGRWAGFETSIRNAAWRHDASLSLEIDRGWLSNVDRVRLYGVAAKEAIDEIEAEYRARNNRQRAKG